MADIYKFRAFYEDGYEFVVGSRMMKGAHNEEDSKLFKPRKWFVLATGFAAKLLFKREGNTVWDTLHGFRGMTKTAFLLMPKTNDKVTIDMEMVCHAYKARLKRIEFPTSESPRLGGTTHFKAWSTGKHILRCLWKELWTKEQH